MIIVTTFKLRAYIYITINANNIMTTATTTQIEMSKEIFNQIGGNKAAVMIGIKAISFAPTRGDAPTLQFSFKAHAKNSIKAIVITLMPTDTYKVQYINRNARVVKESEGIYNDMLKRDIEQTTGLYLSL